jgi:phage baseplate assembly protein W
MSGSLVDLWHIVGSDLTAAASGDLLTAAEPDRTQQRILRRLLTNPGDYIWDTTYGGGLGAMIGQPINVPQITGIVRAQMALEPSVLQDPAPVVNVTADNTGVVSLTIQYTEQSGQQQLLVVPFGSATGAA